LGGLSLSGSDGHYRQKSTNSVGERVQETQALKEQFRLAMTRFQAWCGAGLPDGHIDFLNQRWLEYTGMSWIKRRLGMACGHSSG